MRVLTAYRFVFATAIIAPLALLLERRRPKLTGKVTCQACLCGLLGKFDERTVAGQSCLNHHHRGFNPFNVLVIFPISLKNKQEENKIPLVAEYVQRREMRVKWRSKGEGAGTPVGQRME
ncbi:unnamed protein product [Camellia sinensis]